MVYVLYNASAGAHYNAQQIKVKMAEFFPGESVVLDDTTTVSDKQSYIDKLSSEDRLIVVGGDGTLNRFVNSVEDREYPFPIYCFSAGTGNDFINDVAGGNADEPILINQYITKLPSVEVNGVVYKFLNGIGQGIDGWACYKGEEYKKRTGKPPSYTSYAFKGLLYAYKPSHAKVTVDGVTEEYDNVWMAPTMNGRYFGGGVKITPDQDRLNPERMMSAAIVKTPWRIRLMTIFPTIFKGNHVKYKKQVTIMQGKEIIVEMDRPIALQIDGEVIPDVTKYIARSYSYEPERELAEK